MTRVLHLEFDLCTLLVHVVLSTLFGVQQLGAAFGAELLTVLMAGPVEA